MNQDLARFAAQLRNLIADPQSDISPPQFSALALELFGLQFKHNPAYRKICEGRRVTPPTRSDWTQIPAVPAAVFKTLEMTSLAPAERTAVFHSSGTTEQKPGRHFHSTSSLAVYKASLWTWFQKNFLDGGGLRIPDCPLIVLTPPLAQVPHSSLVHMFEAVRQKMGAAETAFVGQLAADGSWTLDFAAVVDRLASGGPTRGAQPWLLLGTAFSLVHLLDYLADERLHFILPAGSRVMETGGYKNRSRSMPKAELHALITERLGVSRENIICEYGMSELSSQAYDTGSQARVFRFPPWARVQIISPETGREVGEGETGLIRILDLANVFSVAAIQTEDLGVRRSEGFELVGRASLAEPRGCSLMTA